MDQPGFWNEFSKLNLVFEHIKLTGPGIDAAGDHGKGVVAEAFHYLRTLWHPNVCCYTDMLRTAEGTHILVSEGYSLTLDDVIRSYAQSSNAFVSEEVTSGLKFDAIAHQIICGLQYLHAHGIEHGALGPHNIYIHSDGTAKIGCYASHYLHRVASTSNVKANRGNAGTSGTAVRGGATVVKRSTDNTADISGLDSYGSMRCYSSPELLTGACRPTAWMEAVKNDIWALGMTCLQIIGVIIAQEAAVTSRKDSSAVEPQISAVRTYEEMVKISHCTHTPSLQDDAFRVSGSLIRLANERLVGVGDLSAVGINIVGTCAETRTSDDGDHTQQSGEDLLDQLVQKMLDDAAATPVVVHFDLTDEAKSGVGRQRTIESNTTETESQDTQDSAEVGDDSSRRKTIVGVVREILNWYTGKSVVEDLLDFVGIDLRKGRTDPTRENNATVQQVYTIFHIATQCLIIDPIKRPTVMDMLIFQQPKARGGRIYRDSREDTFGWSLISAQRGGAKYSLGLRIPINEFLNRSYRKRYLNIRELDKLELHIDDLFYLWRLMGNDPLDLVEDAQYSNKDKGATYSRQNVPLHELMKICAKADLFPIIIEHQIRPTCAYARQFSFLYQWIRLRRFDKLLHNGLESKYQISTEAQLDIPPMRRKHIWCVLLGLDAPFGLPMSDVEMDEPVQESVAVEITKALKRFDNDILHSRRCVELMAKVGCAIQQDHGLESLPSSLYVTFGPLVVQYYEFSELFMDAAMNIFDKYLKSYYVPSGSFVQNDLEEFNTMLNFFDPEVAAHLQRVGAFADSFALLWFMSLFAETASLQQLNVLWDTMLNFPRNYVKYLAVGVLHSARDGILQTTTAPNAISYISSLIEAVNAPMLNSMCIILYTIWDHILFPKESARAKGIPRFDSIPEKSNALDVGFVATEAGVDGIVDVERAMFTFRADVYPRQRCFKLALKQFAEVFDGCLVVDLRSADAYKLGHIPNSCHIARLLACLEKRDEAVLKSLVRDLVSSNPDNASGLDPNSIRRKHQLGKNCETLLGLGDKAWSQEGLKEACILLAAGDGSDLDKEQDALQRLIFEFHVAHVCYYRINADDWPKLFTLSQI
ncbi:TBC domain-containing protein [Babesia bigemina]|uniref:TBC domain-containing protein n=1 Tax=Babesia bigemina TaxID=5866 RepID=A0A061D2T8_BABBI|nr:TBC domain-containing protein [Babesia bigemina]CDR94392.1 TBC domain-containing protein [Babesia bigemina]|eukprot:XP_012766578.1 TBC domain-containing protein [Babesia bigemina]